MINSIVSGIGFGMLLAVMVGPVFFGLIQTSINKGFKYGVFFAIGVAVSDITFILLTYYGFSNFLDNAAFKKGIGILGGAFMCIFGLYYLLKHIENTVPFASTIQRETKKINIMLKGFVMNIMNPSVFFFWIGMVSVVSVRFDADVLLIFTFFCATIVTVFSLDIFLLIDRYEKVPIKESRFKDKKDFYYVYLTWAIIFFLAWLLTKNTFLSNSLED